MRKLKAAAEPLSDSNVKCGCEDGPQLVKPAWHNPVARAARATGLCHAGLTRPQRKAMKHVHFQRKARLMSLGRFAFGETPRGPRCARQARQRLAT